VNATERERNFREYPPGSNKALDAGCICPVLDNEHGNGAYVRDGVPQYWTRPDCPLHGSESTFVLLDGPDKEKEA